MWLDSHAHIVSSYFEDIEGAIVRAKEANLSRILVVCCELELAQKAIEMAVKHPMLDIAFGFHPTDIDEIKEEDWQILEELLQNEHVVALGEIGLDMYWKQDNLDEQKKVFIRQIELANKYNKPIIVHSRDAIQDTLQLLKENPSENKGILHCFSSSVEMAREFVKLGYMISLAGPVTFKNAHTPKEVAKDVPLDFLLIETDCPFLTPHPFRGKKNEPSYVVYVGQEICRLREIEEEVLMNAIQTNYNRLFHKK